MPFVYDSSGRRQLTKQKLSELIKNIPFMVTPQSKEAIKAVMDRIKWRANMCRGGTVEN